MPMSVSISIAVLVRVLIIYTIMHILVSIMGSRGLSKLTFKDFIIGICMGSVAGRGITKLDQPFIAFFIGLLALGLIHIIFSYLSLKSEFIRKIDNGDPLILIQRGQIIKENLRKSKLSMDELHSLLRGKDIFKFSDVEYALLEPSGNFSVLVKTEQSPLKVSQMNIPVSKATLPILVIKEGRIVVEELRRVGLSEHWLHQQLQKLSIQKVSDILLAQADSNGIIYICFYDGRPVMSPGDSSKNTGS